MIHRGTYDGTIYHNPANRFCIISVKTADKEVPQEARSTRRYRDHLIRFVATGYELPRTDAVELELDGEWKQGRYGGAHPEDTASFGRPFQFFWCHTRWNTEPPHAGSDGF